MSLLSGGGTYEVMENQYKTLEVTQSSRGVLTITLNRPEVRNAFNQDVIEELHKVAAHDAKDPAVRAVVLRGTGKVFCAGGDLNWMKESVDLSFDENLRDTKVLSEMFESLNAIPKPVIGVIHGAAIGGAIGLVSVCDTVIATEDTVFGLSEVRLGIVPACIGPFVVSKVGASQARRLFLSGERFDAKTAKEVGLVHEIAKNTKELEEKLNHTLENILLCSPNALRVGKELVMNLTWPEKRNDVSDYLDYISRVLAEMRVSDEGQEGVRAFLEKRKPSWIK